VPDRCELTEFLVRDCGCRIHRPDLREAKPTIPRGVTIPARFPGRCSADDRPFREGDEIRADGDGGWIAMQCCGEEDHA
jgi:hypothetical protein